MELNEMVFIGLGVIVITLIGVGISFLCYWFYKRFGGELIIALKQ